MNPRELARARIARNREESVFLATLRELELCALTHALIRMTELFRQLGVVPSCETIVPLS
jgi:hypothetical protein